MGVSLRIWQWDNPREGADQTSAEVRKQALLDPRTRCCVWSIRRVALRGHVALPVFDHHDKRDPLENISRHLS